MTNLTSLSKAKTNCMFASAIKLCSSILTQGHIFLGQSGQQRAKMVHFQFKLHKIWKHLSYSDYCPIGHSKICPTPSLSNLPFWFKTHSIKDF
jgi:hypothetical protein